MNAPIKILCLVILITFQIPSIVAQRSSKEDTLSQTDKQLYYTQLEEIEKKLLADSLQKVEIENEPGYGKTIAIPLSGELIFKFEKE